MHVEKVKAELSDWLQARGWKVQEQIDETQIDQLFCSSYAVVGTLLGDELRVVLERWRAAQDYLGDLQDEGKIGQDKDFYLLLVVPSVQDRFSELRDALDDTHVCRKLCIEVGGRSLDEALQETPIFALEGNRGKGPTQGSAIEEASGVPTSLPQEVLDDLAKMGLERILTKLLDGEYDH